GLAEAAVDAGAAALPAGLADAAGDAAAGLEAGGLDAGAAVSPHPARIATRDKLRTIPRRRGEGIPRSIMLRCPPSKELGNGSIRSRIHTGRVTCTTLRISPSRASSRRSLVRPCRAGSERPPRPSKRSYWTAA